MNHATICHDVRIQDHLPFHGNHLDAHERWEGDRFPETLLAIVFDCSSDHQLSDKAVSVAW